MGDSLKNCDTIDLIFELLRRDDFYGAIVHLRGNPSDIIAVEVPGHVPDEHAKKFLKAAADSYGKQ